ncbi:hypothetical protein BGZ49_002486 [Haplosporangium sp. Z 27]|nr:hypothetical protein BGZ49_002486 [Haplosporangium sp. Z 27]
MFAKSTIVAALAFVAAVSAQTKTSFTNPVGNSQVYAAGSKQTFTWQTNCVAPSTFTATDPTAVKVQLLNSTDPNNAYYLEDITTVNCSTGNQGNVPWTVPTDLQSYSGVFSLQMVFLEGNAYSGSFKITAPGGSTSSPSTTTSATTPAKTGAANVVAPALSGLAAAAAAAAMLL